MVRKVAIGVIDGLNLALSSDPVRANKQREVIVDMLKVNDYEVQGDRIITLNSDGSRLEDEHGNLVDFMDRVKNLATSLYDVADKSKSTPNGKETPGPTTSVSVKDQDDYIKKMGEAKTNEEKAELTKAYKSIQESN